MRKIGVLTTSRADYSVYRPLLKRLHNSSAFELMLFVTGTHLSEQFGHSVQEIKKDGFPITEEVAVPVATASPADGARAMGLTTEKFSHVFQKNQPDLLVALGDRYEMHAAVTASVPFLIPVAHIAGGVVTEGAIDELFRHSITKMAHLHFAETETFAQRLRQMGEEPWRVFVTGALALDNLKDLDPISWNQLSKDYRFPFEDKPVVVTFHPVTQDSDHSVRYMNDLLQALSGLDDPVVFTGSNADTHGQELTDLVQKFVKQKKNTAFVSNFGPNGYYHMLQHAKAMVGNSSSGLVESPSFKIPVVNIGDRQKGRLTADNVITVGYKKEDITAGLKQALQPEFRKKLGQLKNPYGDGQAAERIEKILAGIELGPKLLRKKFQDLS